jgi:L-rhamnose mutarotase
VVRYAKPHHRPGRQPDPDPAAASPCRLRSDPISHQPEDDVRRYCFLLQVRPDRLEEYVERHRQVWPEMLAALRDTGWHNYSLFLRDDGLLVGYVESEDLGATQRAMARTEVNARWQTEMAEFFTGLDGRPPDEGFLLLTEIFNLDDQLDPIGG